MRLIFVTDTLCSGGAERVVSILANHLADKYQTQIICLRKMDVFYGISPKVEILFADDYAKGWYNKMRWLRNYVQRDDVVIPFMVKVYCVTLIALFGKKTCVIASERNDPRKTTQPWRLFRWLLVSRVERLVVQTNDIKKFFGDKLGSKIEIILSKRIIR